jgi:hypothetical protein
MDSLTYVAVAVALTLTVPGSTGVGPGEAGLAIHEGATGVVLE